MWPGRPGLGRNYDRLLRTEVDMLKEYIVRVREPQMKGLKRCEPHVRRRGCGIQEASWNLKNPDGEVLAHPMARKSRPIIAK